MANLIVSGRKLMTITRSVTHPTPMTSVRTVSSNNLVPPPEKTKYYSIHDIPDEMIPMTSKRDPDNPIYRTRRFVNLRKRQLLYQQRDGVPVWYRTTMDKVTYWFAWVAAFGLMGANFYVYNRESNKKTKK